MLPEEHPLRILQYAPNKFKTFPFFPYEMVTEYTHLPKTHWTHYKEYYIRFRYCTKYLHNNRCKLCGNTIDIAKYQFHLMFQCSCTNTLRQRFWNLQYNSLLLHYNKHRYHNQLFAQQTLRTLKSPHKYWKELIKIISGANTAYLHRPHPNCKTRIRLKHNSHIHKHSDQNQLDAPFHAHRFQEHLLARP